jgi:hypothetical protein
VASVAGIVDSYRRDLFRGKHKDTDTYKMAVYDSSAAMTPSSTLAYDPANEVVGAGYVAGGVPLTGFIAQLFGAIATLDFDNPVIDPCSITGRYILIYNDTLPGKDAVLIGDMGADITSVNGPWSPGFPAPGGATSLIQW